MAAVCYVNPVGSFHYGDSSCPSESRCLLVSQSCSADITCFLNPLRRLFKILLLKPLLTQNEKFPRGRKVNEKFPLGKSLSAFIESNLD